MVALFVGVFAFAPILPGGYWLMVPLAMAGIPVEDGPGLLGWMEWLLLPLALIGVVLGQMSVRCLGRNLNLVLVAIGIARLFLVS